MADTGHVFDESFGEKLLSSETMELDLTKPEHKELATYWRHNAEVVAAIEGAREREGVKM